jgi:hypothetical protein
VSHGTGTMITKTIMDLLTSSPYTGWPQIHTASACGYLSELADTLAAGDQPPPRITIVDHEDIHAPGIWATRGIEVAA